MKHQGNRFPQVGGYYTCRLPNTQVAQHLANERKEKEARRLLASERIAEASEEYDQQRDHDEKVMQHRKAASK